MYTFLKKTVFQTVAILCIMVIAFFIVNYSFPVIKESELQNKTLAHSGICTDVYRFSEFTNKPNDSSTYILEFDDITFYFSPHDLRNSKFSQLSALAEKIIGKEVQARYLDRTSLYTGAKRLISLSDDETTYLSVESFNRDNRINRVLVLLFVLPIPIIKIIISWVAYFKSPEFRRMKKKIKKRSQHTR